MTMDLSLKFWDYLMGSDNELYRIFKKLKIKADKQLLQTAFTHSSMTFENETTENYERLEFLGDSVLKLTMSETLYKKYPEYNEGRMTKIRSILVSDNTLAKIGKKINIPELIIVGNNEKKDHGAEKESVIACVMEAVMGAVYISCGMGKVSNYIKHLYGEMIEDVDSNLEQYNAKAMLQEYTQGLNKDLPEYKLVKESGKAHNKTFYYEVYYHNDLIGQGEGKTKRDAQQDSAKSACIKLGIIKQDSEAKNG